MDTDKYAEGQYLNSELVESSPSKRICILNEGEEETNQYGNSQLKVLVELDGKQKSWSLPMDAVRTFRQSWGKDSKMWIQRTAILRVITMNGKKKLIAIPETIPTEAIR